MINQISNGVIIAVGTILASIIAASIAYLNLVISKEQKISEFRQAWINDLRKDISALLGAAAGISTYAQILIMSDGCLDNKIAEKQKDIESDIERIYESYNRIILRLNPEEDNKLIEYISKLEKSLSGEMITNPDELETCFIEIRGESSKLFKKEWSRVKNGEITYRVTKIISSSIFGFAIVFAIYFLAT